MKEPDGKRELELEIASEDEKIQSDDCGDSSSSSSQASAPSFLTELNLLMVLLSTIAPLDDEENADFEEREKRSRTDNEAMISAAKLRAKRLEINIGKPIGRRRSERLQTAPKDIRHGRRM